MVCRTTDEYRAMAQAGCLGGRRTGVLGRL